MKKNEDLQKDVQDAIKWEPLLCAAEIGVTAQNGVVTLTGIVNSFAKKMEAENAAKSVKGVKAIVEKIEVKFSGMGKRGDNEIAAELISALKWNFEIPDDKLKIKVENGFVTLEGELQRNYQKEAIKKIASNIVGVKGVSNAIQINAEVQDGIEKKDIERALRRNWSINEHDIQVLVSGNNVKLNGFVHSLYQKEEAGRIASNAPGVWTVDNELAIEYSDYLTFP